MEITAVVTKGERNFLKLQDIRFFISISLDSPTNANKREINFALLLSSTNLPFFVDSTNFNLSPCLLKNSAAILSAPLAHLINLSITTVIFPMDWKKAKVAPSIGLVHSQSWKTTGLFKLCQSF